MGSPLFTFIKSSLLKMEKNEILYKPFQVILSKQMNSDNQQFIYCEDDGEYIVFCYICDNLCNERFYKKHLKPRTHKNNIHKRQQLHKSFQIFSKY